jgi:hypothetical protein
MDTDEHGCGRRRARVSAAERCWVGGGMDQTCSSPAPVVVGHPLRSDRRGWGEVSVYSIPVTPYNPPRFLAGTHPRPYLCPSVVCILSVANSTPRAIGSRPPATTIL